MLNRLKSSACLLALLLAGFVLPGLSACAVAPVQEMSDARQALKAAEQAGAAEFAADSLERAQALLRDAETQLSKRRYNEAREDANAAKAEALVALRTAENVKQAQPD
ncbi:MAG: DUF4398 domain-containing protein [Gammaproteobacteria bacterium]|nr:DUF4398 domain-containing protein [Gammaproteobacteria bacterium]